MKLISISFLALILFLGNISGIHCFFHLLNSGDTPTAIRYHPYHASLQIHSQHVCSGAIIDKFHILTSANCGIQLRKADSDAASVVTGTSFKRLTLFKDKHEIKRIYVHPYYVGSYDNYSNNIAVIKLQSGIKFSNYQQSISLSKSNVGPGDIGVVTGWRDSRKIRKAEMMVYSSNKCREYFNYEFKNGLFCAVNQKGLNKHQGDNGSPMVINGALVGISSCVLDEHSQCVHSSPDVYTNVFTHSYYIQSILLEYQYPPFGTTEKPSEITTPEPNSSIITISDGNDNESDESCEE